MQNHQHERPKRFIDMQMPLTWLLSSATAILMTLGLTLWNIAQQSLKLDQLIIANAKIEKRLDDRDVRIDMLRDKIFALEKSTDAINARLEERNNHTKN